MPSRGMPGTCPANPAGPNVSPWTSEIFSSSVSWLTRLSACRWASGQEMPPEAGASTVRAAADRAGRAWAAVPGAAVTRARQAAAVAVMTADRAALPYCRCISDPLRGGQARSGHVSGPGGGTVRPGVSRARGTRARVPQRVAQGHGNGGTGPVIGRRPLYGAALLSGDAQINGGCLDRILGW